jgi:hypothetical protein
MEIQIFQHAKNIVFKKNQNPSRYYNSKITNLKFQHKPKYHLSKTLVLNKKIDLLLLLLLLLWLPRGQNPLSYSTLEWI